MTILIPIILTLFSACSVVKREYTPNNNLLIAWKYEEQSKPLKEPYVVKYRNSSKELYFIATKHEHKLHSKTFELIKKSFKTLNPQAVIIEGFNAEVPAKKLIKLIENTSPKELANYSESLFTASLAYHRGISFFGGEPSPEIFINKLDKSKYTIRDLMMYYILRQMPQWQRQDEDIISNFNYLLKDFVRSLRKEYSLDPSFNITRKQFITWYQKKNKRNLNLSKDNSFDTAPICHDDAIFTQALSCHCGRLRDSEITLTIARLLNKFDRVIIVYGAGHYATTKHVIQNMIGNPYSLENK